MHRVIDHLQSWLTELRKQTDFVSVEERAERLGLLGTIETAIKQIELCQKYGINTGSWFCVFPERVSGYSEPMFRVVCDNETHRPAGWKEVEFPGRGTVEFHAGDLAIKR